MGQLTTHEVLEKCEITSAKTLTRWHQRGLIPPPLVKTHPDGRGKIAYWPSWIIFRIREVKAALERGESLDGVAQRLSRDWPAEEKKWIRKKPDFKAAMDQMNRDDAIDVFSEKVADVVYDYLQKIGIQRPGGVRAWLWDGLSDRSFIDEVRQLLWQGYTPVIAIIGQDIKVIPDFLLGSAMTIPKSSGQPVLIVPIRDAFLESFAEAEPDLPKLPKFTPTMQVIECTDKRSRRRTYRHKSQWEFAFED